MYSLAMELSDRERVRNLEQRMKLVRAGGNQRRVLFLDFDGVFNVSYETDSPEFRKAAEKGNFNFYRSDIVERLNRLIHEYELHVVVSSSWRYSGIAFCQQSLYEAGFDSDVIIEDITETGENWAERWKEILNYTEAHNDLSAILILDDINMKVLSPYAVQTEFYSGYTESCDSNARNILDRQINDTKPKQIWLGILAAVILVLLVYFFLL